MSDLKRIIWPIEPSSSNKKLDYEIKNFFKKLNGSVKMEIQPVCVMGSRFSQVGDYFEAYDNSTLRKYLVDDCKKYLEEFSDLPINDLVLLDNFHNSQSAEIMLFSDYVEKENPDFVVMGSHGRKGWDRAFVGSFTESFLLRSVCPVFVIGPNSKCDGDLNKVLMPVELDASSQSFIEHFMDNHLLSFVKDLRLYHKISLVDYEDIAWAPTFYGVADYSNEDVVGQARKAAENFLGAFMEHPLSQKRVSYIISDSIDSTSEAIVSSISKEKVGLVVMRSLAGAWTSRILGSVTKSVIRASEVPVLVYPCQYKEK